MEDNIEIIYRPNENFTEKLRTFGVIICFSNENKKKGIRIFGEKFVNNNRDKCKIIYENKEYELTEYFSDIDSKHTNSDIISIKLKGINKCN